MKHRVSIPAYCTKIIFFLLKYFFALFSSTYLFLFGFLFVKNRNLIMAICRHFGYSPQRYPSLVPKVPIARITDEKVPIYFSELMVGDGSITCIELICLMSLMKKSAPAKIFELGTFEGRTTLNFAINSAPETVVYSLDLPRGMADSAGLHLEESDKAYINKDNSGILFKGKSCEHKIVQLFGDTAKYDFSPFYGTIDFIFIDASHSYEYVMNDSLLALKLLRDKKSIIVWHDYGGSWDGVSKALNELYLANAAFKGLKHINNTSLAYLWNSDGTIPEK